MGIFSSIGDTLSDAWSGISDFASEHAGTILGAGLGGAGAVAGSLLNNYLSKKSAKRSQEASYEYWRKQQLEAFPLLRESLESAGYNPMLALHSSPMSGNVSRSSATAPVGDIVGSARQGVEVASLMKEQVKQAKIKTEADKEQVNLLKAQKRNIDSQTEKTDRSVYRDWSGFAGDLIGDSFQSIMLYNLLKDRKSIYKDSTDRLLDKYLKPSTSKALKTVKSSAFLPVTKSLFPLFLGGVGALGYGAFKGLQKIQEKSPSARKIMDMPNFGSRLR